MGHPALTMGPMTAEVRHRLAVTAAYFTAFVALGLFAASLGPTLPGLAENTRSALGQISYLFTARAFGYLLGSFFGGQLYDRLPGHRVMVLALAAMALVLLGMPLIPLLPLLVAVILLGGIAEGVLDVGGNTLLVWLHRDRVGPFMNGLHFAFGLGAFLAPIVIAQAMLFSGGIRGAYWALALLMAPPLFWLWPLQSPLPLATRGERSERSERSQKGS